MRMWMIDPKLLCRKHLLGEHGEIHKHKHCFDKHFKMDRRFTPFVAIEPFSMQLRHDELANEMVRRGYNHNSYFEQPDISYLPLNQQNAKVDIEYNIEDLCNRCEECRKNINGN